MLPSLIVLLVCIGLKMKKHVGLMLIILLTIASQYIFYVNQLPSNTRYDFPALLLFPILDLVAMSMIVTYFTKHKYGPVIKLGIYTIMMAIFSFYIFHRGYTLIHLQSLKNVRETTGFESILNSAEKVISDDPNIPVIFVSERFIDFEPIASVAKYLNSRGISNPIQLYYNPTQVINEPMELDVRLKNVMNGERDPVFELFSKFEVPTAKCYSITFGSASPLIGCPEIARF